MRLAPATCPLLTALVLTFQSPAAAGPDPAPRAHAADAPPGGQRDAPAPVRVVLVRPANADPITAEALVRIQGELAAEGFSVVLVDAPAAAPPCPPEGPCEHAGDGPGATVDAEAPAVRLSLDTSAHVAEIVIVDRPRNKKLTRWIDTSDVPPDHLAAVLAVRAVELVRASLVELSLPGARPPEAKAPDPSWGLEAGVSVLGSPGGVGPAALTFARLRFAPLRQMELRLAFAGLGTSPRVEGPDGASARVTQLLALAEVALRPWPDLRARPSFALGAGALQVAVEGEAASPYKGIEGARWAALLGGGAGVEVRVGPRLGVAIDARAFAAIPYPTVRFLGVEAARVAMPGLLASVTLVGWL
jgi:hypothetical protein